MSANRIQTEPSENLIIRVAVKEAQNRALPSKFSGGGNTYVTPDGSYTVPIEDGDDWLDGHLWMLGYDDFTSPAAFLGALPTV